jgi:hypothetical protein
MPLPIVLDLVAYSYQTISASSIFSKRFMALKGSSGKRKQTSDRIAFLNIPEVTYAFYPELYGI